MKRILKLNPSCRRLLYVPLFVLLCAGASLAQSQTPSTTPEDQELTMSELLKLPGKVVVEGTNTKPAGKFSATTYRVEE
ncbi:MAG TPA: hypothetical protein VNI02_08625, partial [Blastocatellia bacterium]|nr:hypothetical protein [Blastocatellia bacterium]